MTASKISASIIGVAGYSGEALLKILSRHPHVTIDHLYGQTTAGKPVEEVLPAFTGVLNLPVKAFEAPDDSDVVFLALPSGEAMTLVPGLLSGGKKVIDLGGDFRLQDPSLYQQYYKVPHTAHEHLRTAIYSIPELQGSAIQPYSLVANPGCYPTSAIMPLAPLLKEGVIGAQNIIINSLSGVTGAGKKATQEMSFAEIDSSIKAYRITDHQHVPEIEQALSRYSGKDVSVIFTPHLVPLRRGIYTTIVADLAQGVTRETIDDIFADYYASKYFVRLRGEQVPELKHVVHTNFIDIGWKLDLAKNKLVLISALDNLLKGAAGQAVQNMNLLFGLPEEAALQ